MITKEDILKKLSAVPYPGFSRDIVSFGLVKDIEPAIPAVRIVIQSNDPNLTELAEKIESDARAQLDSLPEGNTIRLDIKTEPAPSAPNEAPKNKLPGVKKIIAVASGKGGVGKSTVSTNLAIALSNAGKKVGLCDCDLYGPSIALMLGNDEAPLATQDERILPLKAHGIDFLSMGNLVSDDAPVIVRGPIANRYTQQFLLQTAWNDLDVLVLDLPPGTGDIQLTIVQALALDGAVVVTTPQEVALIDARKAASMFEKVNVPILGIIENMSYFQCPDTGKNYPIFGEGGGEREAEKLGVPLLGKIPIDIQTRESGDKGKPIAATGAKDHPVRLVFEEVAQKILSGLSF